MSLIQESGWRNTRPVSTPGTERVDMQLQKRASDTECGKGPHDPNLSGSRCGQDIFNFSKDSRIRRHSSNAVIQNRTLCLMMKNFQYYQETQELPTNFQSEIEKKSLTAEYFERKEVLLLSNIFCSPKNYLL